MLYIVATPIGNLEDITVRALKILREVDFILCEDTRVTMKLLNHYDIKDKKLISCHEHTGEFKIKEIIRLIDVHKTALVTDAGTPGIADPGVKIIKALQTENIKTKIVPLPGASALIAALSISGLPADKFLFMGFPPHKKGRQKFLKEVLAAEITVVFYESCHRIVKCLQELQTLINTDKDINSREYNDKHFVVCRELTKIFESVYRGSINEVLSAVENDPVKGEYVVVAH